MARNRNTNGRGSAWSEAEKLAVWAKGYAQQGYDPRIYRKDRCGHWMQYSEHGNVNSNYGWEIDHINPVANNGGDNIDNLQPLYWQNNRDKGDSLNWRCPN